MRPADHNARRRRAGRCHHRAHRRRPYAPPDAHTAIVLMMPADRSALFPAVVAIGAATAASCLRIGDFGLSDALQLARETRRHPVVLTLDLTRPLRDQDATGLAALRARGRPTLRDVIEALEHAAGDDRVVGLVGRV